MMAPYFKRQIILGSCLVGFMYSTLIWQIIFLLVSLIIFISIIIGEIKKELHYRALFSVPEVPATTRSSQARIVNQPTLIFTSQNNQPIRQNPSLPAGVRVKITPSCSTSLKST